MKLHSNPFLRSTFIAATVSSLLAATSHAADLTWDNGATTDLWNITDTNWTAATWNNATPDNAMLNGTAPGTITLGENITAGTLTFSSALAYTLDGNSNTLTVNGDMQVAGTGNAQSGLTLTNGAFHINRIVTKSTGTGDWGVVNINSGAVVTATTGIDGSVGSPYTFALNLNGGSLYTPSIKVADLHQSWGNSFLTFNGTEVFATTADNADFIQTYGGFGNNHTLTIAGGGAILNSNGFNISITQSLIGSGGLTKKGAGTLTLTAASTYTGNTTVEGGTLSLGTGTNNTTLADTATVSIASGATLNLNYTGTDVIGKLIINNVTLPGGIYDATLATPAAYRSYFTGNGSLTVLAEASGTWTSLTDGNWEDPANWLATTIASGSGQTATFNAATGVTVTLTGGKTIGNLAFAVSDVTLAGAGTLTLESSGIPAIGVTSGNSTTIAANLGGTNGFKKTGDGTLKLTGTKSYSGSTTVTGGTLELSGGSAGNSQIHGSLTVSSGATASITNGDGTGFGWNGPVNDITIDAGTLHAISGSHIGFGPAATVLLSNGGSIAGNWQWNGDGNLNFTSSGNATNTISGALTLRADDGASHAFFVENGSSTTDLLVSANLSDQWPEYQAVSASGLTKDGDGTMVLSGTNTYDGDTAVNSGALEVTSAGSLRFRPTTNGTTNAVSGNSTASLSFLGTVSLDLTAATATGGNSWTLFNLGSFTGPVPTLAPAAVTTTTLGSFTEVTPGVWELPVTAAKWTFTTATGSLAYVVTATDYDIWKSANGVTGGDNDDDDHDGLTNRGEYAFGLNPTGGSSVNPITVPLNKSTGTFTYTRRTQSLTALTYSVWVSTNLDTWTGDTGAVEGTTSITSEVETVTVTLSPALLTHPKLFIQVRAN